MKKVSCGSGQAKGNAPKGDLKWWQLSLIGIGCTIGTGYFLGSGIGVKITGPAIVISFLLAAIGTYVVYHFLAMMTRKIHKKDRSVIMLEKLLDAGVDLAVDGITGFRKF